ncbi:flavodoxin domain-containing protein [Roseateles sp. DB2]|uniref:flavodoxin domain-containing protein n=1 Tax=Roseateles sp. DB2 TaxID=3453717 RepID=UPI003EEAED00
MTLLLSAPRVAAALLLLAGYLAFCTWLWWRHRRSVRAEARRLAIEGAQSDAVLVLHASQTGQALALAEETARRLRATGRPVRLMPLGLADAGALGQARQALIIASTTGEGDAPDSALPFVRHCMQAEAPLPLHGLQMAVLALGDRRYRAFCAFGLAVEQSLRQQGAVPLFEALKVDCGDARVIDQWWRQLGDVLQRPLSEASIQDREPDAAPVSTRWILQQRRCLNPGSQGAPLYLLRFAPLPAAGQVAATWQAGDLVQVLPPGDAQRPRSYSIASLPADGALELLVRERRDERGELGAASAWLCHRLEVGQALDMRLRAHEGFRQSGNEERALILIGNGTGLAGLRAHLKRRAEQWRAGRTAAPVWLLHGERQARHDTHFDEELQAWHREGLLAHVDRVYSRDLPGRHVQQQLQQEWQRLREWLAHGAAIYVCGSLQGMGQAVDRLLREQLGEAGLQALIASGRYRRDVY